MSNQTSVTKLSKTKKPKLMKNTDENLKYMEKKVVWTHRQTLNKDVN
jgi:hypothetical protein